MLIITWMTCTWQPSCLPSSHGFAWSRLPWPVSSSRSSSISSSTSWIPISPILSSTSFRHHYCHCHMIINYSYPSYLLACSWLLITIHCTMAQALYTIWHDHHTLLWTIFRLSSIYQIINLFHTEIKITTCSQAGKGSSLELTHWRQELTSALLLNTCESSVISHQLSIINYQLSIINH